MEDLHTGQIFYTAYPLMDISGKYCHIGYIDEILCDSDGGHIAVFKVYMLDSHLRPSRYEMTRKRMERAEPHQLPDGILNKLFFLDI